MGYRNHVPRRPEDDYQTDATLALEITKRLAELIPPPKRIVEPSAGVGAFVKAARIVWPDAHVTAVEVRPECETALKELGANQVVIDDLGWENTLGGFKDYDLVLGNPPYSHAQQHAELGLTRLNPGGHLAFLLRMAFLNSQSRVETLWSKPTDRLRYLLPLAQRPSFTGDGKTEHSEYAQYIWEKDWTGDATLLKHLWVEYPKRNRRELPVQPELPVGA